MATKAGQGYVEIVPEFAGFQRDVERQVEQTTSRASRVAQKALRGGAILSATVTPVVLAGLKGAVDAASDLNESLNAVEKSYGDAAGGVKLLGEEAAQSLGLSNSQFNDLAVRFSSFAQTIAGDGGDVVGTLDDLTTRASDFASVMNIEVSEAAEKFQSGLAGETEPLREFGIDLSAAAVEAHALEEGIIDSAGAMTESEKIQARYSLLMEETAKFAGDFADTSDDAANAQRIAKAEWEDASAALGESLLPLMADAAELVGGLAEAFNDLPDAGQKAVLAFAGLVAVAGPVTTAVGAAVTGLDSAKTALGFLSDKTKTFKWGELSKGQAIGLSLGAAAVGMEAIVRTANALNDRGQELDGLAAGMQAVAESGSSAQFDAAVGGVDGLERSIADLYATDSSFGGRARLAFQIQLEQFTGGRFASDIDQSSDAILGMTETIAEFLAAGDVDTAAAGMSALAEAAEGAGVPLDFLVDLSPALRDALANAGLSAEDLAGHVSTAGGAADVAATDIYSVADASGEAALRNQDLADKLAMTGAAAEGAVEPTRSLRDVTQDTTIEFRYLEGAAEDVDTAIANLDERYRGMVDGQRDVRAATSAWEASLDDLTASVKENGTKLDLSTEKGRANEAMLREAQDAAIDHSLAVLEETESIDEANKVLDQHREDLKEAMIQAGFSEEAAEKYSDEIKRIPDDAETRVEFDNARANERISDWMDRLNRIPKQKETLARLIGDEQSVRRWLGRLDDINREIRVNASIRTSGGPTAYHSGTDWHPGGPAIVNDAPGGTQGELINLPGGSSVTRSRDSVEMLAAAIRAGGGSVDHTELARAMSSAMSGMTFEGRINADGSGTMSLQEATYR